MADSLTGGAIARAMRDEEVECPTFQILGFKKIAGQGGADRFRLHISDGVNTHSFAMLATQLNHLVTENRIDNFALIRVDKYICNTMNNKRIMILLQLDVITPGSEIGQKIGNPAPWIEGMQNVPPPQANGHSNGNVNRPVTNAPVQARNESSNARPSFYGTSPETPKSGGGQSTYNSHANRGGGGGAGDISGTPTIPIRDVNPYNNKVTIRARVTHKGEIKHWSNSRGEGKLFSVDLLDDSAAVRMTGFNNDVDRFYELLELDKVYYFCKFSVKAANRQFNNTGHDYELSFTSDSVVQPYLSDASDIPKITFNFVTIKDLENVEKEAVVDLVGVCQRVGELSTITSRNTGKEFTKRDIVLVDQSNTEINVTLWAKAAEDFNHDDQPVVAIKGAKVSDFGGKSLSLMNSSTLSLNPDLPEAHALRGWFDNGGTQKQAITNLSSGGRGGGGSAPWKVCREANAVDSAIDDKGEYFMAKVFVLSTRKENCLYQACGKEGCNKKVIPQGDGTFRCEKCNEQSSNFKWRLMLSVNFGDFSDNFWATAFQEAGEILLGKTAEDLGRMKETSADEFEALEINFEQFIGKFRAKMETYNNETRKKITVVEIHKVNFAEYNKKLLQEIKETSS